MSQSLTREPELDGKSERESERETDREKVCPCVGVRR